MTAELDPCRVLVVDDDEGVRYTLLGVLEDKGLSTLEARNGREALELLAREQSGPSPIPLLISDLRMPEIDGMELLARLQAQAAAGEVVPKLIMITAHGSERLAVEAMKVGAYDYFRKPFDIDELSLIIDRALAGIRVEQRSEQLESEAHFARSLVFESPQMARLARLVHRVGPRDVTVLLTGESGTGKERVAEAIYAASARRAASFVRFNCAALNPTLAEAELFGHAKGAFTGAHKARAGLFREADGGTLLLDEIGELDLSIQAKLLRVLQSGEVRPVGQDTPLKVDVRVIAATHQNLQARVAKGSFREDLYYRLKVVELHVPPLRERPGDIAALTHHFLRRTCERFGIARIHPPPELIPRLSAMPWPGNVRELENAIESLVALSEEGQLELELLDGGGALAAVPERDDAGLRLTLKQKLEAYERGLLVAALDAASGNRSEAARALGIGRATLHDKLKKYALDG